jgi:uncharacterized protein (TIGR03437 family)
MRRAALFLRLPGIYRAPGLLIASVILQAQPVTFIAQAELSVGSDPVALAIGDFTRQSSQDIVVANQGSATLTLLHGLGNGFFQPLNTLATGISPHAVVTADFNGDGRLDAAVANFASNSVSVLLGNGNGTFRPVINVSARGPVSLAVEDFNADGKPDLAVAEFNSNSILILLGNGDGTFRRFFQSAVGDRPTSIATGDFNRDGKLDLAVANANSNSVSILLGVGNGTFLPALDFAAGQLPAFVVSGDFNRDGKLDLAVANATGFSTSTVSILLGNGNGSFQPPLVFQVGSNVSFLAVADFNLDGKLDLAVADTGSDTISILLGLGNGTFQPPQNFDVGSGPAWIGVTDLNGDGKPDLIVANSHSDTISILINRTPLGQFSVEVNSIVNAASFKTGAIAPGEMLTVFGSNLGPQQAAEAQLTGDRYVATDLAGTQVLFDGLPAPVVYASAGQLTAIVPYAIGGHAATQMMVANKGVLSSATTIPVTASAPALFTAEANGTGHGAILNEDGSVNSGFNPAARGSMVMIYATGAGQTDPQGIDGMLASDVLPKPVLPVSVIIAGQVAQPTYAGAAPGLVAGVMQVNVRVPDGISSGAVPVQLQVGDQISQAGVTLNVQ